MPFNCFGDYFYQLTAGLTTPPTATVADRATFDQPHQYSVGFREVLVNGRPVLHQEQVTAERPGRVLLGPAAR